MRIVFSNESARRIYVFEFVAYIKVPSKKVQMFADF